MKDLTKERAHDLCVEMWNEMAENGYESKSESSLIKKYKPLDNCFACEYYTCKLCPFTTLGDDGCCEDNSPYDNWLETKDRLYAIEIADIFIGDI